MTRALDWAHLHDAVLRTVALDWKTGEASLTFGLAEAPSRTAIVKIGHTTALRVPREHPWGPSVHVNEASAPVPTGAGKLALRIEMQSGDVIEVEGDAIEIAEAAGHQA